MEAEKSILTSIVVVNLNDNEGLLLTLKSIQNQSNRDYEVILVDGGSTDNSLATANKFTDININLIVGQDTGIYNAMNLGIQASKGKYIHFLNSGDLFYSDVALDSFANMTIIHGENKLYSGYAEITSKMSTWLFPKPSIFSTIESKNKWLSKHEPNHQAMFFPQKFCLSYPFDEDLKIIADRKFKRLALDNLEFFFIEEIIVKFSLGGISTYINSQKNLRIFIHDFYKYHLEESRSLKKFYDFLYDCNRILAKYILQKIINIDLYWGLLKKIKYKQ